MCLDGSSRAIPLRGVEFDQIPTKEVFVLAPRHRGPFIAIYDQADGAEPSWRGDTAVFRVPTNGVLRIRYPEPPTSTRTSHVFVDRPAVLLPNYPTCADMRAAVTASGTAICWLDFSIHLERTPDHVVAVVTDWADIPRNFERAAFVYDSVLLGGKGLGIRKWEDPPDMPRKRASFDRKLRSSVINIHPFLRQVTYAMRTRRPPL